MQDEYGVQCVFDNIAVHTARWVTASDERKLEEFRTKAYDNLAVDHSGALVYLAPSRVNLRAHAGALAGLSSARRASHADRAARAPGRQRR